MHPYRYIERCHIKAKRKLNVELEKIEVGDTAMCVDVGAEEEILVAEENIKETHTQSNLDSNSLLQYTSQETQTPHFPGFGIHKFYNDCDGVHYYTGLESYDKFKFVLQTLGAARFNLSYYYSRVLCPSIEDQFFVTLLLC